MEAKVRLQWSVTQSLQDRRLADKESTPIITNLHRVSQRGGGAYRTQGIHEASQKWSQVVISVVADPTWHD